MRFLLTIKIRGTVNQGFGRIIPSFTQSGNPGRAAYVVVHPQLASYVSFPAGARSTARTPAISNPN